MPGRGEQADDVTIARRVETQIFRPADAPKGAVSVNAENGVVFLRGVVEDREWIDRLGAEAARVDGVEAGAQPAAPAGDRRPGRPGRALGRRRQPGSPSRSPA